jgi:hypothetical protein
MSFMMLQEHATTNLAYVSPDDPLAGQIVRLTKCSPTGEKIARLPGCDFPRFTVLWSHQAPKAANRGLRRAARTCISGRLGPALGSLCYDKNCKLMTNINDYCMDAILFREMCCFMLGIYRVFIVAGDVQQASPVGVDPGQFRPMGLNTSMRSVRVRESDTLF